MIPKPLSFWREIYFNTHLMLYPDIQHWCESIHYCNFREECSITKHLGIIIDFNDRFERFRNYYHEKY